MTVSVYVSIPRKKSLEIRDILVRQKKKKKRRIVSTIQELRVFFIESVVISNLLFEFTRNAFALITASYAIYFETLIIIVSDPY